MRKFKKTISLVMAIFILFLCLNFSLIESQCALAQGTQNDAGSGGDAGEDYDMALEITAAGSYTGYLDSTDTYDVYKIWVTGGQTIGIIMTPPSDADFELILDDLDYREVAGSILPGSQTESVSYTAIASGFHYFRVYQCSGSGTYFFATRFTTQSDAGSGRDAGEYYSEALNVSAISSFSGYLDNYDTDDWYKLYLDNDETMLLTIQPPADTYFWLRLYDPNVDQMISKSTIGEVTVQHTATFSGYHYIRIGWTTPIQEYGGSGYYQINWSIISQSDAGSGSDAGDTIDQALHITPGSYTGRLDMGDENDFYSVDVPENSMLIVNMTPPPDADFDLSLYDSDKSWLTDAYPGYFGESEVIAYKPSAAGRYYFRIWRFFECYGRYSFEVSLEEIDSYEPDDSPDMATSIPIDGTVQIHSFSPKGDRDYVKFTAISGGKYTINAGACRGYRNDIGTEIVLYGDDGPTEITRDDDGGWYEVPRIVWTCTNPGTYYVMIHSPPYRDLGYGLRHQYKGIGFYYVSISAVLPLLDNYEPDDAPENAALISTDGTPQRHTISPLGDVDYVKFSASSGRTYYIQTSLASDGDTLIILYDADGNLLWFDDDSGSGKSSKIVWRCWEAGTYYVEIMNSVFSLAGKPYFYDISISEGFPLKKLTVPLIGQETDASCWAASSQMVLEYYGVKVSQKEIARQVGSEYYYSCGLVPGLNTYGNWETTLENLSGKSFDFVDISWARVMSEINDDDPIIDLLPYHVWVIIGYNDMLGYENDEVFINDPWPPTTGSTPGGRQIVKLWEEVCDKVESYYSKAGEVLYYWDSMCVGGGTSLSTPKGEQNDAGTESDAGDNFFHATTIAPGEYVGYLIEGIDHRDFYKFDASSGQEIRVAFNPPFDSDLDLMLFDPEGSIRAGSYKAVLGHPENVTFTADSSGDWVIGVQWISGGSGTYSFNLYLKGAPEEELLTYKVFGHVKSEGVAIAGAQVTLDGQSTTTDENGYYEFTGLEGNTSYTITVSASGYESYTRTVSVGMADELIDVSLSMKEKGLIDKLMEQPLILLCLVIVCVIVIMIFMRR